MQTDVSTLSLSDYTAPISGLVEVDVALGAAALERLLEGKGFSDPASFDPEDAGTLDEVPLFSPAKTRGHSFAGRSVSCSSTSTSTSTPGPKRPKSDVSLHTLSCGHIVGTLEEWTLQQAFRSSTEKNVCPHCNKVDGVQSTSGSRIRRPTQRMGMGV